LASHADVIYLVCYLIRSIVDDGKCYALAYYHVHLSLPPFLPGVDRQSLSTLLGPGHTLEPIWGLIGSATLTRQLRRPILLVQRFSLGVQLPALGIETDYQGTSADAREVILGAPPGFVPITNIFHAKIESIGTVRARLGGLLRPDLLAYVTGGWAYGLVKRQWEMACPPLVRSGFTRSTSKAGLLSTHNAGNEVVIFTRRGNDYTKRVMPSHLRLERRANAASGID
jgi:hypothetical protein